MTTGTEGGHRTTGPGGEVQITEKAAVTNAARCKGVAGVAMTIEIEIVMGLGLKIGIAETSGGVKRSIYSINLSSFIFYRCFKGMENCYLSIL